MLYRPNCKVVLLGKESTGKSCLVRRFTENEFDATCFASTVGASYAAKKVDTSHGEIVISVWDTAGQERFDSLTKLYYNGASAALICVDLTDGSSFGKAQFWAKELRKHQPSCSCYIVVTKSDLLSPAGSAPSQLPHVPECLSSQQKIDSAPKSNQELSSQAEGQQAILTESGMEQGSKPDVKTSDSPISPFDRRLSSGTLDKSAATDGSISSSWQSGSSSRQSVSSPTKRKEVADSQLKSLAQSVDAKICRTSSATGEGVCELFKAIAEDLAPIIARKSLDRVSLEQEHLHLGGTGSIRLSQESTRQQEGCEVRLSHSNGQACAKGCCY